MNNYPDFLIYIASIIWGEVNCDWWDIELKIYKLFQMSNDRLLFSERV
jgi:hypothetical protein